MLQGQWRRNLSSSAGSAQLRPNFWKILRRFPIQLSTTKLAGCLLLTPIHPNKRANTHTYRRNNSLRGSTDVGHKSKGFLKKLPINRRVNSVQWAFSPPPRTLKFLNSPEKKKRVRQFSPFLVCLSLLKSISTGDDIDVYSRFAAGPGENARYKARE